MTIALEHFAFTTFIIPAHDPESPAQIRNIVRAIKAGVLSLIRNFIAGSFPMKLIPAEIRRTPKPDFLRVLFFDLLLERELLEQPFETGHALVRLIAILFPHLQKTFLCISEAIAEFGETVI